MPLDGTSPQELSQPTPETKQKSVPPKTKDAPPKTTNTYAAAAAQTLSGRTTPENGEYQGPTGVYETTRPSTPINETAGSSQNTGPTYDEESPFNATAQPQKGPIYQLGTNNKKRALHVSPNGSPKSVASTNILAMMTDPLPQPDLTSSPYNQY